MSRPPRHATKSQSYPYNAESNGPNGTEAPTTSALSKARARLNEPVIQLQNIFPDWKEEDLISVLEEARGDVEMAVTRISEGHAEQWGSVKHKKDKKPLSQRERDGLSHHPNSRGGSSPRGRGRGGRGAGPHSSSSRQNKDRNTNGVTPASLSVVKGDLAHHSEGVDQQDIIESKPGDDGKSGINADASEIPSTVPVTITRLGSGNTGSAKPEGAIEPPKQSISSTEEKEIQNHPSGIARKTPASSGLSWAQIAKPQAQIHIHTHPTISSNDAPSITSDKVEAEPPAVREAPTTVETPIWDDEPPQQDPLGQDKVSQKVEDGWVDASITPSEPILKTQISVLLPESKIETATAIPSTPPTSQNQPLVNDPHVDPIQQPIHDINPPPGLANPAPSIASNKPSTPSNARPSIGIHRPSSRYKTDKAVNLPPQTQATSLAFGYGKPLAVQFGSLDISTDEPETQMESQVTSNVQEDPVSISKTEVTQSSHLTASPHASYGDSIHQPQELAEPLSSLAGPVHTQAPSVNPSLAVAPAPGASFPHHIQPSLSSQHTLAGLTHTPTSHGPTHTQQASFSQQGSFPQQYDNSTLNITGSHLNNPSQLSQTQTQGFFRQTDSTFFNQTQGPSQETHFNGVGSGGGGGYSQGIPSNFNPGPGLNAEFGYDTQRPIPYETYNAPLSTRNVLRQDDLKGLGSNAPALGVSHSHSQSSQIGNNQSAGAQGQSQYPGMAHMTNPYYYNVNIPPYGYGNQFYSPAFTSFVNPMFQGGGTQTPPHGSKPSHMVTPSGIGVHGGNSFGSGTTNSHHHSNSNFDGETAPNAGPPYHQASVTPTDFGKSVYSGGQSFLGNINTTNVGANRSVGGGSVGTPVSLPAGAIQDPTLKGYGGSVVPPNLTIPDKTGPSQVSGRGTNLAQNQQQFYQGSRFPNVSQNQAYPGQQQPTDNFYPAYQRW